MRNSKLAMMLAAPVCLVLSTASFAATTPAKATAPAAKSVSKPAAKPAAKPAKFNQKAVMDKFWNGPDSAVVGTIGSSKVTKGDLVKMLWDRMAPSALSQLLEQRMVEDEAAKMKITVTPAEIDAQVKETLKRTNMQDVDQLLTQYRATYYQFMASMKTSALITKIVQRDMKIADTEYAQYMKASHILIKFPTEIADAAQKDTAAKAKIEEIAKRLKSGEDFAKVASEVSQDDVSKIQGGSLGWFSKGRMIPEFEKAAFALKPGEVSEPIKTTYGYHIIKSEALGSETKGAERSELKATIMESQMPMKMSMWYQNLKNKMNANNMLMPPVEKPKAPAFQMPQGGAPAPRPAVRPAPKQPAAAPSSEKPEAPPAPPAE